MLKSSRLVGSLVIAASLIAVSTAAINTDRSGAIQEPRTHALEGWQTHLDNIGFKKDLRDQMAPQFLGQKKSSVPNEHGGVTVTFDGSRPGLLATVKVVLDGNGRLIGTADVMLADVLEAR
ncbi:MAG: hypothetical protein ACI89X_004909 [Planctomycetota bacterium]|jgi:hypothetical protein